MLVSQPFGALSELCTYASRALRFAGDEACIQRRGPLTLSLSFALVYPY